MTIPCPRQAAEAVLPSQRDHVSYWHRDSTCSYCGSLSPTAFFAAIESGCEIGPTDKSYKVYVTGAGHNHAKFYFQHLSEAEKQRFIDLLNAKQIKIGFPGHFYVAPFFIRFGDPA